MATLNHISVSTLNLAMREPLRFPTVFARNLHRIMEARGWNPRALSISAGLSKGYVTDILRGKILVPGTKATNAIADLLGCTSDDLTRDSEPRGSTPDPGRLRGNRRRALEAAERAMGDEDDNPDHAAQVFSAAEMIYDLIVEREAMLARPIAEDDEEFWRLIDSMARRWIARRR